MSKNCEKKKNNKIQKPPRQFKFYLGSRERYILFDCNFDSGNIALVRQLSQFHYRLASIHDGTFTDNYVNSKSWFYFSVQGFPKNTKGKFIVSKVQTLTPIFYSKYSNSYRPVFRVGQTGNWERVKSPAQLIMRQNGQLQCAFEYIFNNQLQKVYFAFCYPHSYEQNIKYIASLSEYLYHEDFYYHQQVLTKSPQGRFVHLLTITSYDHKRPNQQLEQRFDQKLFPQDNRPLKFNKPVVLITARVHPGQTAASFAMQGAINFLTDQKDLRAHLLRKMFVFLIVPMINVDGVYHGHFRMDIHGKNLNRFYLNPCHQKQPAIYAIKQLVNYLSKENRLSFYFDLHAHNAKKGSFIYGNAISDFVEQVESQVFCKLISMNNKGFEYEYCNFSQRHMKAKDRFEDMTKQGCGRVVIYRLANIIHSYTLECGIVSANQLNTLPDPMNTEFKMDDKGLPIDECQDNNSPIYKVKGQQMPLFTIQMYRNLGKNLLVSILDVFDKNPYNRVYNSKYKSMDMLRRLTAFEVFHQAQRFRMFQKFVFGKVKNINDLIRDVLQTKLHYKKLYNFYFHEDQALKNTNWPQNITGLNKPKSQNPSKVRKFRGSTGQVNTKKIFSNKIQYQASFMQVLNLLNAKKKQEQSNQFLQQKQDQIQKNENSEINSSVSSETEDLSPLRIHSKILQGQTEEYNIFIEQQDRQVSPWKYFDQARQRDEFVFSDSCIDYPDSEEYSPDCVRSQFQIKRQTSIEENAIRLTKIQLNQNNNQQKKSQNSAVRVRRLLKQEGRNTVKSQKYHISIQDQKEIPGITNQTINSYESRMANDFRKNLYDSIKNQIRQGLRKQGQRKTIMSISERNQVRGKCWSVKKGTYKQTSRIQLPSLGSQMFVISTSTKLINKKF